MNFKRLKIMRADILSNYLKEHRATHISSDPYENAENAGRVGTWAERFELVEKLSNVKKFNENRDA